MKIGVKIQSDLDKRVAELLCEGKSGLTICKELGHDTRVIYNILNKFAKYYEVPIKKLPEVMRIILNKPSIIFIRPPAIYDNNQYSNA